MTDKMKCPFCGSGLEYNIDDMLCPNAKCSEYYKEYAPHIWQALIDGKKAVDALLFISNIRGCGMSYQDMFLDAHAIAKYVLGQTPGLILIGRYTQDQKARIASITNEDKE